MPPAVSDDESDIDVPDAVPARPSNANADPDDDEDEEEDEDEDEYQVETIVGHKGKGKKLLYEVKWLGYEETSWEPVENLENSMELVSNYNEANGVHVPSSSKANGKRASTALDSPAPNGKRAKTEKKAELPIGSWEDHCTVAAIIEEEQVPGASSTKKTLDKQLVGMLEWNDGRKTQHGMKELRTKCPQKLLDYYEGHLVFKGDPRYVDNDV